MEKQFNLNDLKQEIPYKYKVESMKGRKAFIVSYIDARDVMDLLDKVVGPQNWSDDYSRDEKGVLCCCLSIKVDGEWVSKCDAGTQSDYQKEKGEYSDAFKRAAVKWGVGRFLYDLDMIELPKKQYNNKKYYPAREDGSIIWTAQELNDYINSKKKPKAPAKNRAQESIGRVKEMLTVIASNEELNVAFRGLKVDLQNNTIVIELFKQKRLSIARSVLENAQK